MSMPQIEIEKSDVPEARVVLSTHGPIVSISSALIKLAFTWAGAYLLSKTGADMRDALTYIGIMLTGGGAASLGLSLHGSNEATRALQ